MARPIVLSNGELHVGLNQFGLVHDFYYPYVGLENHAAGAQLRHKVGVWINGVLSWLDDGGWTFQFRYPHTALVGHTLAKNEQLGVVLEFDDCVDSTVSAFLRNVHVINLWDEPREIRLFFHQAFAIGDSRSSTDTAQYLPDSNALLHYRGRRSFIISGRYDNQPFDQHSIGLFGIEGREGTYKDAEDGELSNSNVEHGRVDSVIRFKVSIAAHSSARVHYWIAAGMSIREALYIHKELEDEGITSRIRNTADWWQQWLAPTLKAAEHIPEAHQEMFIRSSMILKSQIDKRGAVMASTDSSMLNYSRDTYAYSWPRDGAYVIWPLIRMGYKDEAYRFFEFCKRGLHPSGYLLHKYQADGALGSSWHPYVHGTVAAPPIQEDETALVVFMFEQFYNLHKDGGILQEFYQSLIKPAADFMAEYIDPDTKLPRPSYDLWEEVFLTTTYTTSVTYAALRAAARLATIASDDDSAVKWNAVADDIQENAGQYLFNKERGAFYKGILSQDGHIEYNDVIDTSSIFGAFIFNLFDADSEEIKSSVEVLHTVFGVSPDSPALPRYENDNYRRNGSASNWWFITSLWLAQYQADIGNTEQSLTILNWVKDHSLHTGMLGEQIDPSNGATISPAPLTWSHAEYLSTLLDLGERKP